MYHFNALVSIAFKSHSVKQLFAKIKIKVQ